VEAVIEKQIHTSPRGVLEVVKVRPIVALAVIHKFWDHNGEFTLCDVELLRRIVELDAGVIPASEALKYYEFWSILALKCIIQGLDGGEECMTAVTAFIPNERAHTPLAPILKAQNSPKSHVAAIRAATAYGIGLRALDQENLDEAFRIIIKGLGDHDQNVVVLAGQSFNALLASIDKRYMDTLSESEREDTIGAKRAASKFSLQFHDAVHGALKTATQGTTGAISNQGVFDAFLNFFNRGLEYGHPAQKIVAVEAIQDLFAAAAGGIGASAATTIIGKCSKALFVRHEGALVLALMRLCLHIFSFSGGGKEKMVDGSLALGLASSVLCDAADARTMVLTVAVQLLKRSPIVADPLLTSVKSKTTTNHEPFARGVLCRFTSTVVRHAPQPPRTIPVLLPFVRDVWGAPENTLVAGSVGYCLAAISATPAVTPDDASAFLPEAMTRANARSTKTVSGFAYLYGLITLHAKAVTPAILQQSSDAVIKGAATCLTDRISSVWVLRLAAALLRAKQPLKPETFFPLLGRMAQSDEYANSAAHNFINAVNDEVPNPPTQQMDDLCPAHAPSTPWTQRTVYDIDADDEMTSDSHN